MLPGPPLSLGSFTCSSGLPVVSTCTCVCGLHSKGQCAHSQQVSSRELLFPLPQQISSNNSPAGIRNTPASSVSAGITLSLCFALSPKVSPGIQLQTPPLAADLRAHPLSHAFPLSSFPSSLPLFLTPTPQPQMHLSFCLGVYFRRTQTKSQHWALLS